MTRKQAVCRVLEILVGMEAAAETVEVMEKLAEIRDELPLTGWSEGTICDALGTSNSSPYGGKSKEKWTEDFIAQFAAIKPESAEQYDRQRRKKSPSWQTIAKYNGKKRWTELLSLLGLAKATEARAVLTVTRTIRLDGIYISGGEWPGGKPPAENKLNAG